MHTKSVKQKKHKSKSDTWKTENQEVWMWLSVRVKGNSTQKHRKIKCFLILSGKKTLSAQKPVDQGIAKSCSPNSAGTAMFN